MFLWNLPLISNLSTETIDNHVYPVVDNITIVDLYISVLMHPLTTCVQ